MAVVCCNCRQPFAVHCGVRPFACPDGGGGYTVGTDFKAPLGFDSKWLIDIAPVPMLANGMSNSEAPCGRCNHRYGSHSGMTKGECGACSECERWVPPLPSTKTNAMIEAKKQTDRLAWLDDAYHPEYGHDGACTVCGKGWNRVGGPKEDDIFPFDGVRKAPKLFHLTCLEAVRAEHPHTWMVYQHWEKTGEILS